MIKRCKMNWETEEHTFEFNTGGSVLESIDFLGDMIQSLIKLHKQIADKDINDKIPEVYKVKGGFGYSSIKAKQVHYKDWKVILR
jgi:hypothetical protein